MFVDTGEESIKSADNYFYFFRNVTGTVMKKNIKTVLFPCRVCTKYMFKGPTCHNHFAHRIQSQPAITCSKLIIETLEQGVQYAQS